MMSLNNVRKLSRLDEKLRKVQRKLDRLNYLIVSDAKKRKKPTTLQGIKEFLKVDDEVKKRVYKQIERYEILHNPSVKFDKPIELKTKIDSILNQLKNYYGILISKGNKVIYEKYHNNKKDTQFRIFSLSKPITALAISLLVQENKLKLSDTLSKFWINIPYSNKITIDHLLNHTSGVYNVVEQVYFEQNPKEIFNYISDDIKTKPLSFETYLKQINKNKPTNKPGEIFEYNDTGYDILGYIIYLVSEIKTTSFIRKYVFESLNMNESNFHTDNMKNESTPYESIDRVGVKENYNWFSGNAFIVCTLRDYNKFLNNYTKLLNDNTLKMYHELYFFENFKFGDEVFKVLNGKGAGDFTHNHLTKANYEPLSISRCINIIDKNINVIIHENYIHDKTISYTYINKIIDLILEIDKSKKNGLVLKYQDQIDVLYQTCESEDSKETKGIYTPLTKGSKVLVGFINERVAAMMTYTHTDDYNAWGRDFFVKYTKEELKKEKLNESELQKIESDLMKGLVKRGGLIDKDGYFITGVCGNILKYKGMGSQILDYYIKNIEPTVYYTFLHVLPSRVPVINLYKKKQFEIKGQYDEDGVIFNVMRRLTPILEINKDSSLLIKIDNIKDDFGSLIKLLKDVDNLMKRGYIPILPSHIKFVELYEYPKMINRFEEEWVDDKRI